jgi:hypothetical protein
MLRNGKIVLGAFAIAVLFSSCESTSKLPTGGDDVYLDPKKDRSYFHKVEEPKPAEAMAVQKTAAVDTSNNPYYKDKKFNYDDYYDNQYASRIRRFHNPCNGVGYYDSYYTNSYFYNYNPYQYGVSIYNGYNFWGPSYNNYMYVPNYNWGGYYGYGSNYGYNSYYGSSIGIGYSSGYYNNWCNPYSFGYSPYYGYNSFYNPYYSPYGGGYGYGGYGYGYNPYGYNNSYDYNSYAYYGPRVSHSGHNSKQVINPGMEPLKMVNPNSTVSGNPKSMGVAPTDIKRFDNAPVLQQPHQTIYTKGGMNDAVSSPHVINSASDGSYPHVMNPGNNTVSQPVKGKPANDQVIIQPVNPGTQGTANTSSDAVKPKRGGWFSGGQPIDNNSGNNSSTSSSGSDPKPKKGGWFNSDASPTNNNSGGNNNGHIISPSSSGSSWPSGGGGGGGHHGGGGGTFRPR